MSDGKLTAHENELIDRYGPGSPPQAGTLYFYEYDPFEDLPDDPRDRDDLANARLRFWTLERHREPQSDSDNVPDQRAQRPNGHARTVFELKWWPLNIAIAWVLTRDRTFVEREWKRRGNGLIGIDVGVATDRVSGQRLTLEFPGVSEAWARLKSCLEEGAIKTVGTPFRRVADSSSAASEASQSQREIEDAEMSSLMLHEEHDELCLIPEDWRVARGSNWQNLCGYRNVQVRPNGVLVYFPVSQDLTLPSQNLGPPRSPFLPGWMSVSDAAYWIASEGGRVFFSLRDLQKWQAAFYLLLPLMSVGKISVVGRRHGKGLAVPVPPASFAGIAVDYPYSDSPIDLVLCERPHLGCYGIVDDEHWEKGFHDRLRGEDRHIPEYSHLQISNSDLAREFPFLADKVEAGPLNGTMTTEQGESENVVALAVASKVKEKLKEKSIVHTKRGRDPEKFTRVKEAMRTDLINGSLSEKKLFGKLMGCGGGLIEKVLEERYGAGRDTCRRARNELFAERTASKARTDGYSSGD